MVIAKCNAVSAKMALCRNRRTKRPGRPVVVSGKVLKSRLYSRLGSKVAAGI